MKMSPLGVSAHAIRGNDCSRLRRWWSVMGWQRSCTRTLQPCRASSSHWSAPKATTTSRGGSAQARVGGDAEHDVVVGEGVSYGADDGEGPC
jgi:hypothetical protein